MRLSPMGLYTLVNNFLIFAAWVGHYQSGNTKPEADRLTGEQMGCSARTVRDKRSRIETELQRWPGLAGHYEALTT